MGDYRLQSGEVKRTLEDTYYHPGRTPSDRAALFDSPAGGSRPLDYEERRPPRAAAAHETYVRLAPKQPVNCSPA